MSRISALGGIIVLAALGLMVAAASAGLNATHLDGTKNPFGCAGCHKGHGKAGTPMLDSLKNEICFTCHGISVVKGKIKARQDLQAVFVKRYRHPVFETSTYHSPAEQLPERSPSAPRHVACQDCHKVHASSPDDPLAGIRGYAKGVIKEIEPATEYMLCYNCHSDSANLPPRSTNKAREFDLGNQSYHPIEGRGRNHAVPSLISPLNISSTIKCTDCHGNDDSFGPKGPHGSNHEFMLKAEYGRVESAEHDKVYELCYSCHDRRSILSNASFQRHKEHIVYNRVPCAACHNPHGSQRNPHLMDFDEAFIGLGQLPVYSPSAEGRPTCLLKCHIGGRDVNHDMNFYQRKHWP